MEIIVDNEPEKIDLESLKRRADGCCVRYASYTYIKGSQGLTNLKTGEFLSWSGLNPTGSHWLVVEAEVHIK